jgi:DNA-binding transcriptional ArsR family regulator
VTAPQTPPGEHAVVGPDALKGLAHPLRLRLIAELNARGSATASQLGEALGESSGSTSYHLRQLHRHGFVEEDPERGTARERVWVPRKGGWSVPVLDLAEDPATAPGADMVMQAQLALDQRRVADVMAHAHEWPEEWRDTPVRRDTHVTLDAAQTKSLQHELEAVVERYKALAPGDGARRVSLVYMVMPTEHEADR